MRVRFLSSSVALCLLGMVAAGLAQPGPGPGGGGGGPGGGGGGPGGGGGGPGGGGGGGQATQEVMLRFCNASQIPAYTAIASRVSVTDERWVLRGWWSIPPGQCVNTARVPKGWVYDYSEGQGTNWAGKDVNLCVEYPGPFERILKEGDTCPADRLKGFTGSEIKDPQVQVETITLN